MIIMTLITLALAIPAYWLALKYNMHMFQLNSYKAGEQTEWIKRNFHLQWILVFAMALGLVRMIAPVRADVSLSWPAVLLDVLIWITLTVIILVYRLMGEMNSKKPLKFTPRVKRMTGTIVILSLLFIAYVFGRGYFAGASGVLPEGVGDEVTFYAYDSYGMALRVASKLAGAFIFLVGAQLFFNILANIVNSPMERGINNVYIKDAKRILAENQDLTVIGVTGSYGKTSVKFYLETLLRAKYSVLVTPESYNTPMGVVKTIRGSLRRSHEIFVCEMGARYVGEIKEICDIVHPHHGIITSIGPQHLDTFGNIANIQATKFELADALPEGGMLFLNADNDYIKEHYTYLKGSGAELPPAYEEPVMYHGVRPENDKGVNAGAGNCDANAGAGIDDANAKDNRFSAGNITFDGYYASDIRLTAQGTTFTAHSPDGDSCTYDLKLVGAHNIVNVMGAIAVSHKLGIALEDLRIPVRRIQSVPHRMEMKSQGNVTIIDDAFNSNPIGSKAAVETLAMFDGMRILITPGMVELGEEEAAYNMKFGVYAAACCDYILLVGGKHTDPIREGAKSEGFPDKKCIGFDRVEEAIEYAYGIKTKEGEHKYILLENDLPDNY